MPGRSKEDTWGAKELTETIKDARSSAGKSKHRDKEREKDKDRDREKRRDKDKDRERHRDKDRDRDKDKEKDRHRDKDKDKEREKEKHREKDRDKHRDKDRDREKEKHRDRDKERDKERHRDKDKDKERRKERDTSREKDRERKKDRERDSSKEKERSKHRDKDGHRDRERSKDRDRHRDKDKEKREKSHRDKRDDKDKGSSDSRSEKERHRDKDKEKHRDRSKDRHGEKDKERRKTKDGEDGSRDRDKHKDEDRERRKEEKRREKEKERGRKEKEGTDSDREKRRHRDKEDKEPVKEEIQKVEQPVEEQTYENGHQEANDDYEDDFEDYDDDFEDDDEEDEEEGDHQDDKVSSEIDEMRRAMAAENQAMRRSADSQSSRGRSERSSASSSRPTTSRSGRTFINFVAAKQREISDQVSQRTKKRGQELMNLIDLDTANYDILDMPPVREYDRYIASFGRSNTKQAFVQCNEDNLEREIQTEEIDVSEKWTQHPADGAHSCGGTSKDEVDSELVAERETNSLRYTRFMEKSTQLIAVLLDEEMANRIGGKLESNKRSIVFSDGYTLMNTGTPILQGRCVTHVVFHPVQTNLILTMHSMPKKKVAEKAGLTNRGLMCVWNVNEPSRPQKILVLKSVPTTCTFSPAKATMAFCGTADGSVCVWDLREPSNMHQKCEFGWGHIIVRVPTYSTEAGTPDESHLCSVVAMQPIVSAEDAKMSTSKSSSNDNSGSLSFQLASVDERGTISFWVVLEIDKPDEAGSESDLGLVPSGKIKLIKSSSIQLHVPSRELGPVYQLKVTDMQLMPSNPNHFFVTTDAGFVTHGARNTERVSPKYYWVNEGVPVGIKTIDFSPFNLPCFLVACTDGSVHLFSTDRGKPLASWPNATQGMDITALSWSRSRPSVFYVMDITSKVYVWELLDNDSGPVKTEQFTRGRLTALSVANDHAATGWGVAGRKPEMIIADELGSLDVHQLNSKFCTADASELDSFNSLLEELI